MIAVISSVVATGRRMKSREGLMSELCPASRLHDPHPPRCARHPLPQCGRGAKCILLKAPLPHRGRGGTEPEGLVGEGSAFISIPRNVGHGGAVLGGRLKCRLDDVLDPLGPDKV